MVPFESLETVSYLHSMATRAYLLPFRHTHKRDRHQPPTGVCCSNIFTGRLPFLMPPASRVGGGSGNSPSLNDGDGLHKTNCGACRHNISRSCSPGGIAHHYFVTL